MLIDPDAFARSLVGEMGISGFNRDAREKHSMKVEAALSSSEMEQFFDLSALEALFSSDAAPTGQTDIFHDGHLMRLADVQKKSGKSNIEILAENLEQGATIRVRDIDSCHKGLGQLSQSVQRLYAARSQINLYLTPPSTHGFPPHFDITDVFVLQCVGCKMWKLYPEYSNQIELPSPETDWMPDRYQPTGSAENVILRQGDVLYMPRGAMHEAFCGEEESLHFTISIVSLTYADLVRKAIKIAAEREPLLRRRVPWSFSKELEDGALQMSNILAKIAQALSEDDLKEIIDAERASFQISEARKNLRSLPVLFEELRTARGSEESKQIGTSNEHVGEII